MVEFLRELINKVVIIIAVFFAIGFPLFLWFRHMMIRDAEDHATLRRENAEQKRQWNNWEQRGVYEHLLETNPSVQNLERIFQEAPKDIVTRTIKYILLSGTIADLGMLIKHRPEYRELALTRGATLEREEQEAKELITRQKEASVSAKLNSASADENVLICARCRAENPKWCKECGNCLICNSLGDGTCFKCWAKFFYDPDDD